VAYFIVPSIIDLDDPRTWPEPVIAFVSDIAQRIDGSADYTNDLDIDRDDEDLFRTTTLTGHLLLAYHCTRLLDHERENIRNQGLRRLTRNLVNERIALAVAVGAISQDEAASIRSGHAFAVGREQYREGQVCLFASRTTFDERVSSLWRLLATWGGEGIYCTDSNEIHVARLRTIGSPSVVVATLDMSAGWRTHDAHPGTLRAFTGKLLGFEDHDTGINYTADIAGANILGIWQPGDAEYDLHRDLPSS
jgi:hypothetical protein